MKHMIKSNYFQFGKSLINRLICLIRGHEWKGIAGSDDNLLCYKEQCTRCNSSTKSLSSPSRKKTKE